MSASLERVETDNKSRVGKKVETIEIIDNFPLEK